MNGKIMTDLPENKLGIKCQWMEIKRALINHDGQVFPCCYFANIEYATSILGTNPNNWDIEHYGIWRKGDYVPQRNSKTSLQEYIDTKDEHNVFNHDLEEILNNEWFTKTLPESWNDEDKCQNVCKKFCSMKSENRVGLKSE